MIVDYPTEGWQFWAFLAGMAILGVIGIALMLAVG
jgi:hypothetical protein